MPNPSPHRARIGKRSRAKPGNLLALQRLLWKALRCAESLLDTAIANDHKDFQLRCIHAISQSAGQYAKLLEVGELEARIAALEQARAHA